MNSGNLPHGFTIIEVLVVLGLSSFLFVAAAMAMNGDQKQTEFDTGARQIYTQLQSLSSDVQNGLYNNSSIYCSDSSGSPVFSTGSQNIQGTNFGCVYVGKAIQFNPSAANSSFYYVYSLVGNQFSDTSLDPPPAFPISARVLASVGAGVSSSFPPQGTQVVSLPDQFTVSSVVYSRNPKGVINDIVGFYNTETSNLLSNSSLGNQLFVIPTKASASATAISDLNSDNVSPGTENSYDISPTGALEVCFASPLEPSEFVKISFESQSDSTNLLLSYRYTRC
jgi:prepilin-type N-terminal cleavage/methylation domain-containing protein